MCMSQTAVRRTRSRLCAVLMTPLLGTLAQLAQAQPANNACQNAAAITPGTVTGTIVGATNDGSTDCGQAATSPDVWYRYTSATTQTVTVTTCGPGTTYDSVLSVHSACPGTIANQITCNDDSCSIATIPSTLAFQAAAGAPYFIRVAGYNGETGAFELTLDAETEPGNPPPNDACANAISISNGTRAFDTHGATTDSPAGCGSNGRDVWFSYVAPASAVIQVDTCTGTVYDSVVAVFAGACGSLSQLVCNDDSCGTQSTVQFTAAAGTTYLISVGGWSSEVGAGVLSVGQGPAPTVGPDVIMRDCDSVTNWGAVGGVRGYSISTYTCNIGDANLNWQGNTNQHPVLGMHLYRLHNGTIEQIGISWLKNATSAGAGAGCSLACNGQGGSVLGAGCLDVYGSVGNGMQHQLGPRSDVNAFTGEFHFPFPIGQPSGDAIYKRCQVRESDLNVQNFPGALYFLEGVWIAPDDALSGNGHNNATHRRVTVEPGTYNVTPVGAARSQFAAIYAWQDHGGGLGIPDPNVQIVHADISDEGRFTVGARVFDNGNGTWRYEYAVFNLNSHRSGGTFAVPIPAGAVVTGVGFHGVNYHSGEPYDNTPWNVTVTPTAIRWSSPQTFAQNPNSNAIRWGTLYNFRFTTTVPPAPGEATLSLFRPGVPDSIAATVPVPTGTAPCPSDWNNDHVTNSQDFFDFLASFFIENADFNLDGRTNSQDFFDFLVAFFAGC